MKTEDILKREKWDKNKEKFFGIELGTLVKFASNETIYLVDGKYKEPIGHIDAQFGPLVFEYFLVLTPYHNRKDHTRIVGHMDTDASRLGVVEIS